MALVFKIRKSNGSGTCRSMERICSQLNEMRDNVHALKTSCSEACFDYARKCVNPYELLQHVDVRKTRNKNRAFYKLLEVAKLFPDVFPILAMKTIHLCEAPGSFIDATEYLCNGLNNWHASSLCQKNSIQFYPYHLAAKKPNGHSRVVFGDDGTGNILLIANSWCIIHESGIGKANLVTGDGGIELGDMDKNDQELLSLPLICAQTYTAFRSLGTDGSFVLKLFDCFHLQTHQLIHMCYRVFADVHIVKLRTSRISNSERYLVCTNYKGAAPQDIMDHLEAVAFRNELTFRDYESVANIEESISESIWSIASQQIRALGDCLALTTYFQSLGIVTQQDTKKHYVSKLLKSQHLLDNAQQLYHELLS